MSGTEHAIAAAIAAEAEKAKAPVVLVEERKFGASTIRRFVVGARS